MFYLSLLFIINYVCIKIYKEEFYILRNIIYVIISCVCALICMEACVFLEVRR